MVLSNKPNPLRGKSFLQMSRTKTDPLRLETQLVLVDFQVDRVSILGCPGVFNSFGRSLESQTWIDNWGRKGVPGDYDDDEPDDETFRSLKRHMSVPWLGRFTQTYYPNHFSRNRYIFSKLLPDMKGIRSNVFELRSENPNTYLGLFGWASRLLQRFENLGVVIIAPFLKK